MAAYSRKAGTDFWFDFDQKTLWQREAELIAALRIVFSELGMGLDPIVELFRDTMAAGTYPTQFAQAAMAASDGFRRCADFQLGIIDAHFQGDESSIQFAFEDFGQGVLYDERRAADPNRQYEGSVIHMMDGTPSTWVGYHRWHAFARAQIACGANPERWGRILRYMALAWSIQTEANPKVDTRGNPGLPPERLEVHRAYWLAATDAEIDNAFFTHHYEAPALGSVARSTAGFVEQFGFADVQKILDDATGNGRPMHGGRGRFWKLPLADFVALTSIRGVRPIAEPGPDRGARSGLVLALKGLPPFGEGGIPRMPLHRPPVPDELIAKIQDWIDRDCPQ